MCSLPVLAQENRRTLTDSLAYSVELQGTLSQGDHTPLWLNANRYGLSSLETENGYLRAAVERPLTFDADRKWGVGYGLDVAVAYHNTSRLIVQQAYAEGRWLKGVLTVGAKQYPLELKNQQLSTGSQTLGINARPVPQLRLALRDYYALPFTNGWVSLKGHIAYGKTTDDKWQKHFTQQQSKYTEGTLYHSKAGYVRIGNSYRFYPVSLELGLEMACQFGGSSYIPDGQGSASVIQNQGGLKGMVKALVPGGGDVVETDYKNAAGNHLGSWMFRLNFDYDRWYLGIYGEHFFEDHSAMLQTGWTGYDEGENWNRFKKRKIMLYDLKDMMLGVDLRLKEAKWLNNLLFEYIYTKYQSGAVYHDHTPSFSDQLTGLDNYYNHYLYTGWQHWGQVMGNPLYRSPLYNADGQIKMENNRFYAFHLGLAGDPSYYLHYRLLATLQRGFGTYDAPFANPQNSQHLMAEATYTFPESSALFGWSVAAAVGADWGKTYGKNSGVQLTVVKRGLVKNLIKKKR